ncbi:forespore regulator of the sigma-K checkpoint [Paenibacillus algorifonticola]|uniref:Forespore regulator of the sigma-K checkpoint n=1 Tax=Paenibacillus algorifonticola TaxID=684063 RepID=A0A1I2AZ55_9BACL|nr:BofC C-terminal domain-containing protein [Paenibacillus algorifonticola]SFE49049.1 forespore regulator of the sigma-K checkpoint [Paenibacillus algorifonticola]
MMLMSLWKQLKRKLRRRPLWTLGSIALLVATLAGVSWQPSSVAAAVHMTSAVANFADSASAANTVEAASIAGAASGPSPELLRELGEQQAPVSVMLRRYYLCGEESRPLGRMTSLQLLRLLEANSEWHATFDKTTNRVLVEQKVDEFSKHCQNEAYMGVDKQGHLSLFEGAPQQEKVLRTFFQLDIRYLESSLPRDKVEQLTHGIKINDIDEFNSVLSTFSDYEVGHGKSAKRSAY